MKTEGLSVPQTTHESEKEIKLGTKQGTMTKSNRRLSVLGMSKLSMNKLGMGNSKM